MNTHPRDEAVDFDPRAPRALALIVTLHLDAVDGDVGMAATVDLIDAIQAGAVEHNLFAIRTTQQTMQ